MKGLLNQTPLVSEYSKFPLPSNRTFTCAIWLLEWFRAMDPKFCVCFFFLCVCVILSRSYAEYQSNCCKTYGSYVECKEVCQKITFNMLPERGATVKLFSLRTSYWNHALYYQHANNNITMAVQSFMPLGRQGDIIDGI